jgi:hypothetical protein
MVVGAPFISRVRWFTTGWRRKARRTAVGVLGHCSCRYVLNAMQERAGGWFGGAWVTVSGRRRLGHRGGGRCVVASAITGVGKKSRLKVKGKRRGREDSGKW